MHIVIDVGGTKTRMAGTRDFLTMTEPIIFDTPQKYTEGIAKIIETARHIVVHESVDRIAAGLPCLLSQDHRSIVDCTNLPDWGGKEFADDLAPLSSNIIAINDVVLVGLGEAVFGAGKGIKKVAYLTVSTGVNGARFQSGEIDPDNFGISTGRQYVSMQEPLVHWEDMISGTAVQKKHGVSPKELGKDNPAWNELARITAFGLYNSILHWGPDRVVLGGSMFNEIGISVEEVSKHLHVITRIAAELPEIVHSALGDVGGLWGGLALLKQNS